MKLPILIFYSALAYYSANLLKKSNIGIPKYILFSGTASKTASIIDPSQSLDNLSSLFSHVFNIVFNSGKTQKIEIKLSSIPKEITCKGALKVGISGSVTNNQIKFWIGGKDDGKWGQVFDKEEDIEIMPKYGDIDENINILIENAIREFYLHLDEYVYSINIEGKYGIELEAYDIFKDIREYDIKEYLVRGIKAFYKQNNKHIEETLFFYPLIGILNKLAFKLSQIQSE